MPSDATVTGVRAVIQRATRASVRVEGVEVGRLDRPGLVVLVGITHDDGPEDVAWMARKVRELRILEGERSLADTGGGVLLISQFTVYGDTRKGRRPSWQHAAQGAVAEPLYDALCDALSGLGTPVSRGVFGAHMEVELVNDGPVTLIVESP